MGERRGASTSERNARNINNFINKTTKLFFNIGSHLQGANKQTNRKTHWGDVVGVGERSELAQTIRAGLGRVPFLHPTSTEGCAEPGATAVGCHACPAAVPATTPAASGLGRWWRGGCSSSAALPGCRSRSPTPARSSGAWRGQLAAREQPPEPCLPWVLPGDFHRGRRVGVCCCCCASCLPGSPFLRVVGLPPSLEWWRGLQKQGRAASWWGGWHCPVGPPADKVQGAGMEWRRVAREEKGVQGEEWQQKLMSMVEQEVVWDVRLQRRQVTVVKMTQYRCQRKRRVMLELWKVQVLQRLVVKRQQVERQVCKGLSLQGRHIMSLDSHTYLHTGTVACCHFSGTGPFWFKGEQWHSL